MDNSIQLFKKYHFRVVITRGFNGPQNMAADEALLIAGREGQGVLRFYDWTPSTLSLGYFQRLSPEQLKPYPQGVPLVRRPTGGRAVFHDQEVTYSVTLPMKREAGRSWSAPYYAAISRFLLQGLEKLGVKEARLQTQKENRQNKGRESTLLCFAAKNFFEICIGDKKLVGSAQRFYPCGLLQHGSILTRISSHPEFRDFWPRAEDGRYLATSLEGVLGRKPDFMEVVEGYAEVLKQRGFSWEFSALKPQEEDLIAVLAREKYERLDWPRDEKPARGNSQALLGTTRGYSSLVIA